MRLEKLLADFVFRDSRLESHPKIFATNVRIVSRDSTLDLVAEVSKRPLPFGSRSLDLKGSLSGHALEKREATICSESGDIAADFLKANSVQSMLSVPILNGEEALGGIDLIAVPKIRTVGSFLMAAQIKHHRGDRTTGRPEVDRLLAWKDSPFRIGLMVTNTSFSQDARWLADQVNNRAFLRLRDFEDLKRWLRGQFDSEFDWRQLPDVVSLAPGFTVEVPRPDSGTRGISGRCPGSEWSTNKPHERRVADSCFGRCTLELRP